MRLVRAMVKIGVMTNAKVKRCIWIGIEVMDKVRIGG